MGTKQKRVRIEVIDTWTDDHLPCVGLVVNGRKMSLWWTDYATVGALLYHDGRKARVALSGLMGFLTNPDGMWEHEMARAKKEPDTDNYADEDPQAQTRSMHTDWGMLEWGTER